MAFSTKRKLGYGYSCRNEGYLEAKVERCISFGVELHEARTTVAENSVSIEEAVQILEPLSPNQRDQLVNCLGNIANGFCAEYSVNKISTQCT